MGEDEERCGKGQLSIAIRCTATVSAGDSRRSCSTWRSQAEMEGNVSFELYSSK